MVRRRNAMLDLVDRIDQISARELTSGDAKLNETFNALRLRLIVISGLTLGVGLLLAAFTIRRTLGSKTSCRSATRRACGPSRS